VKLVNIQNLTTVPDICRFQNGFNQQVVTALQNGLNFQDNIRASVISIKFPAPAGTNIQVAHQLNAQPLGYFVAQSSTFMQICNGNSLVLGQTFINLKCSVAGATATIVVF
jgi:hypothetical protein